MSDREPNLEIPSDLSGPPGNRSETILSKSTKSTVLTSGLRRRWELFGQKAKAVMMKAMFVAMTFGLG